MQRGVKQAIQTVKTQPIFISFNQIDATDQVWRGEKNRILHTKNVTLMAFDVDKDFVFEDSGHVNEQIVIIHEGSIEYTVGDETRVVGEGDVIVIPPNVPHSARALGKRVKGLDIFTPPRAEKRYHPEQL